MYKRVGVVVLGLLLVLFTVVESISVSEFTECGNCEVSGIWYSNQSTLLLTTDNGLFFSSDEGTTWSQKLINVNGVIQSDINSLYFTIYGGPRNRPLFYVTKDGGATIKKVTPPTLFSFAEIYMHPHNADTFMINTYPYRSAPSSNIYYTFDFGVTWNNYTGGSSHISQVAWSPDRNSNHTIFVLNTDGSFTYTFNYGLDCPILFKENIAQILVTDHHVWVIAGTTNVTETIMYISARNNDPAHTDPDWYLEAQFPFGDELPENGYIILEDVSNQGFLGLLSKSPNWGTLFVSQYEGAAWGLSLRHTALQDFTFDFDVLAGIRGIALANVVTNPEQPANPVKRTMITFDNGGEWRYLTPPEKDFHGNTYHCFSVEDCKLNLHGLTSADVGVSSFYSSSNAVGLIVAVGNVGRSLSHSQFDLSTFLSRDNGLTWFEIDTNPTVYEFGDHGGILVWARTDIATNTVTYSLDEGLTMNTLTFSNISIFVENIITEVGGPGKKFILHGERSNINYIFSLDFSDAQPRICENADYEYYSPSDNEHGDQNCLLGRTTLYMRRKREAQCYNDRDTDHRINSTSCACTFEDYECEWGWDASDRNTTNGFICTSPNPDENLPPKYCPPDYSYTYKTGYRLIDNNQCTGGLQIGAYKIQCTNSTSPVATTGEQNKTDEHEGHGAVAVAIALIVAAVIGAIIGIVAWKKPTVFGNFLALFRSKQQYSTVAQDDDNTA